MKEHVKGTNYFPDYGTRKKTVTNMLSHGQIEHTIFSGVESEVNILTIPYV